MTKPAATLLTLKKVQNLLRKLDPRYPAWLEWNENHSVITAKPRIRLSTEAHKRIDKFFDKLGGGFVRWRGECYFEVPKKPRMGTSKIARAGKQLVQNGIYK